MQNVLKDLDTRMKAALEAMGREFASIRTGRASANLLDRRPRRLLRQPDAR
jgi:ribosome recycling factor